MAVAQQIQVSVQRLPTSFQAEVLNCIEYLLAKVEREAPQQEEQVWSSFSLGTAMQNIQDDDALYTLMDLKVAFP